MIKDILNLEDEDLKKDYLLKNLIRFNTVQRISNESVAEHSYFVVYYTYIFCKRLNLDLQTANQCLMKAILHDTAEVETSDVPHNIKIKYPELKNALEKAEIEWFEKNHKEYLRNDDKCDIINNIVELADTYSVRQYCLNEISLGNSNLKEVLTNTQERIEIIKLRLEKYLIKLEKEK